MDCSQGVALNRSNAIVKMLATITLFLVLASIGGQLVRQLTGHGQLYGFIRLFNLDAENNIPSFYSALLLLFAGALLTIISVLKKRSHAPYALEWSILALGFLYLSVDEAAMLHEMLSRPTTELLGGGSSGIFHRTWVMPAFALVCLLGLFYLKFFLHLPRRTQLFFTLAAVLYVGAAIGLEVVGGHYAEQYGFDSFTYIALATLEETLEMTGVIVFIHALLDYIEANCGRMQIQFVIRNCHRLSSQNRTSYPTAK